MSAAEALHSARVRRVDMPTEALLAITLATRELRGALVIGLAPAARGVGFVAQRPPGRADSPFLLRCRSCLEGGRITRFAQPNAAYVRLEIERGGERFALEATLRGAHGNASLLDARGEVLASLHALAGERSGDDLRPAPGAAPDLDWPALHAEGARLLEAIGHDAFAQQRAALARALRDAARRERKKLAAIEGDLARAADVDELRRHAALVLTHLHALPRDAREATLLDYACDPPAEVSLRFDPALGPKQQAEVWFRRARKLERGAAIARERAQAAAARVAALDASAARVQSAADDVALAGAADEARALGVGPAPAPGPGTKRGQPGARVPYREFAGSGGRAILVGRGAGDNDRLTLDHARPQDLWLHARDEAGAHVVVPLERDEACPPDLLRDAAMLAAHFSQARGHARVDVVYTPRRYVRKPSKATAGSVQLLREKVFRLQLEPARLQQLLAAERSRS